MRKGARETPPPAPPSQEGPRPRPARVPQAQPGGRAPLGPTAHEDTAQAGAARAGVAGGRAGAVLRPSRTPGLPRRPELRTGAGGRWECGGSCGLGSGFVVRRDVPTPVPGPRGSPEVRGWLSGPPLVQVPRKIRSVECEDADLAITLLSRRRPNDEH